MNKYELVLQIFSIAFIFFIVYLLFKFIVACIKAKRLTDFSLKGSKENSEKSFIFKIIYSFSDFLKSLVIFNQYAKTYDKYIYEESRLRKGIDYISTKFLLGFSFIFCYLFITFLYLLSLLFNNKQLKNSSLISFFLAFTHGNSINSSNV